MGSKAASPVMTWGTVPGLCVRRGLDGVLEIIDVDPDERRVGRVLNDAERQNDGDGGDKGFSLGI
jgi:hypothetical protein